MIVKLIVMRKIFLFVILLCWGIVGFTQDGVNFEHLSFKEALDKAQAENKLVFVDCYTSWCGPCRNMTEHIFPQEKVGDYFNSKFVCVKYDMEKGKGLNWVNALECELILLFWSCVRMERLFINW